GGPLGSIGLLGPGEIATYNDGWLRMLNRLAAGASTLLGHPVSRDLVMAALVWAVAVALLAVFRRLERAPWGRVLRAIREDEAAATAVGKNVFAFKFQALVLGALLGGLAGLLLAWQIGVFAPDDYQPTLTFYAY